MKQADRIVIKQFGIQRSGTNYLEQLVKINFSPRSVLFLTNQLQCKHHAVDSAAGKKWLDEHAKLQFLRPLLREKKLHFTFNVRDPMSWSLGFLKHLKRKKHPRGKPKDPKEHAFQIANMNRIYKNWRDFIEANSDRCVMIRFEDLLMDFRLILREIALQFGLTFRDTDIRPVRQEVMAGGKVSGKTYDRATYYLQKQYMKDLPKSVIDVILNETDWEVASYFGYTPEED